jgi:DNA-directed RNA polymerase subunit RPC12/RpoP
MSQKVQLQPHICSELSGRHVVEYQPIHQEEAELADVVYVCGRCDAALAIDGQGLLMVGTLYRCGGCGSHNTRPSE